MSCGLYMALIFPAGSAGNDVIVLNSHSMVTISGLTTSHEEEISMLLLGRGESSGKLEEKPPSAVSNVKSPSGPPEDIELVGHEGSRT